MRSCTRSIDVPAPIDAVWTVLATFDDLAMWAPEVDHSCLLHPASGTVRVGVGAVRRVQLGRNTVLETIVEWSPPDQLSYEITGLPAVLRHVRNDWRLHAGAHGTTVTLTSSVDAAHHPKIAAVRQDSVDGMPQFSVGVGS